MPMLSLVVDEGKMSQLQRTAGQIGLTVEEVLRLCLDEFVARRQSSASVGRCGPNICHSATDRPAGVNAGAFRDN